MKLARSTYYYRSRRQTATRNAMEKRIALLCAEFPRYGYRRISAQLRAEGMNVNHKAVARVMRERALQVRPLRRFVRTTDSQHDSPIFPNLARGFIPTAADQLWVADITYIAIARGFVYLAVILDAWSRRVVGYALGRQIDTRLTLAALRAFNARHPPPGLIHHSDRGAQYAAQPYRNELAVHGLAGSMGRRGNPYDNSKAESFMKTLVRTSGGVFGSVERAAALRRALACHFQVGQRKRIQTALPDPFGEPFEAPPALLGPGMSVREAVVG
jgi:putative transposase